LSRQIRSLVLIALMVGLALAVLLVPEINVRAFGGEFKRGDPNTFLGLTLGLDLQGGTHLVYRAVAHEGQPAPTVDDLEGLRQIIEKRVNEFGVSEPTVQLLGNPPDRVIIQLPGLTGATITSEISATAITAQLLQDLLRGEGGHPEATVEVNNIGAFVLRMDELEPETRDAAGDVIAPAEADQLRSKIEAAFPTKVIVVFNTTPPATATPAATPEVTASPEATAEATAQPTPTATPEPTATPDPSATATPSPTPVPEFKVPTLADVTAAAQAVRPDAEVTETGEGRFEIKIVSMKDRGRDAEGNVTPSDDERLRDAMRETGDIIGFAAQDRIFTWTVGGGVQEAKKLIGSTALLEFRERICGEIDQAPAGIDINEWLSLRCTDPQYYTEQPTNIEAGDLVDAFAGTQPNIARPVVNIVFNDAGGEAFFEVTDRISRTGDLLAIYLDDEELVAPAASQGISGGRAFIQGADFTAERVRTIAIQLRSGALPVSLELLQERNVDATLGKDSLRKTLIAGTVGLVLLLGFMAVYYKVPGLVAALSLVIFTALLLAIFKALPVTMTLAGAAAFILSLGMAIDANVLIAERTKEELRTGRDLLSALSEGFDRSWLSIRDGNIATVIIAGVLFWFGDRFGTSLMQGFALTLGIGTLLSMFTSITVSRVLLRAIARTPVGKKPQWFTPVKDLPRTDQSAAAAGG
jgi:preprotein translocase subunit SecD